MGGIDPDEVAFDQAVKGARGIDHAGDFGLPEQDGRMAQLAPQLRDHGVETREDQGPRGLDHLDDEDCGLGPGLPPQDFINRLRPHDGARHHVRTEPMPRERSDP